MRIKNNQVVYGYKCFNKNLINRYGVKFEVGKTYHSDKEIKFGNDGNGFHMCQNLEDTLRYFDAINDVFDICEVKGFGTIDEFEDDYNGFYNMYSCEYMTILKKLTREEIIAYALNLPEYRVNRFISLIKLSEIEKQKFYEKYQKNDLTIKYLAYYQDNDKEVFNRKRER